ncbi:MAG: competence/damage-inducible protein A [Gemmatimonadetes bacterium]|nr:MAG: competence/damage-inducible protein A [Gemmatimonadota bacterium]
MGPVPWRGRGRDARRRHPPHRVLVDRVPVSLPPAPQGRVKLEVLTIGTELLLGYTVDTNAAELGRALAAAGAEITRHTTVADRPEAIRASVVEALDRTGFVITTGGLGPTRDDMTKTVVADLFGKRLLLDERLLANIRARFDRMGRPMPASNRTQAEVPEGAVILPNARGTAPGLWVEDARGRTVVLLPGVPREMQGLLVEQVLPRIVARQGGDRRVVLSRTVRTTGVSESALAERVGPIEPDIAPLTLAYLPSVDGVDLRVTAWGLELEDAEARLTAVVARLKVAGGEHGYGEGDADLAAVLLEGLRKGRHRLAVAESCTGGMVGERITNIPGASDTFIGGVVAYADVIKTAALKVPLETLEAYGAVSEETVRAMAEGAQRLFSADCTIAVTGIAGPGGGTPEKPVGTVWLAARVHTTTRALKRVLPGDRDDVRRRAAQASLDLLRRLLAET